MGTPKVSKRSKAKTVAPPVPITPVHDDGHGHGQLHPAGADDQHNRQITDHAPSQSDAGSPSDPLSPATRLVELVRLLGRIAARESFAQSKSRLRSATADPAEESHRDDPAPID